MRHYRRRSWISCNDWLPREKLYAMPRSLKTQGSRALGRLAFTDNHQRLMARLQREIQQATHPDAIYQIGQPDRPGPARQRAAHLRHRLRQRRRQRLPGRPGLRPAPAVASSCASPRRPVTACCFCGAPDDPATPRIEQANIYATLTELNHFGDPSIPFAAQYGADGPR